MQKLAFEKEMLGLYISDHPLLGAQNLMKRYVDCTIAELRDRAEAVGGAGGWGDSGGADIRTVGGVITGLQRKYTKKGDLMAVFTLEDLESAVEVMVFPRTMQECNHVLADDALVAVKARVDNRDDTPKLIAMTVQRLEINLDGGGPPVRVQLPERVAADRVEQLKLLLEQHPGDSEVFLHFGRHVMRLPPQYRVEPNSKFIGGLRMLLGADALVA